MTMDDPAAFRAVVLAQDRARSVIRTALLALLRRLWAQAGNKYDQSLVDAYTRGVALAVAAGQQREADLAAATIGRMLALQGLSIRTPSAPMPERPRGVDPEVVAERPVREYRRLRLQGLADLQASIRAERRALVMADADLTLGMRQGARVALEAAGPEVIGHRRIVHPELSAGGTCGLCIAASHRIYSVSELAAVHDRCHCTVAPVLAGLPDPGNALNRADLEAIYAAAGSTGAADLKRVRYAIHQHGELGPVLTAQGDEFRGPADAARDTPVDERPAGPVAAEPTTN